MRDKPDCNRCEHFYVTWDAAFPYGCKGFQMKSKRNPASSVLHVSGTNCMLFAKKKDEGSKRKAPRKGEKQL
jgi:hypothetical protein